MPLQSWAGTVSPALGAQVRTVADGSTAGDPSRARCLASAAATAVQSDVAGPADLADLAQRWQTAGSDNNSDSAPSWPADPANLALDFQPGADLAEQLIPSTPLRFAAVPAIAGPPRYAGEALPEPHLPRLPRPPRG